MTSRAQWRSWLSRHHGQRESIWLVTWRKHHPRRHVPYDAVVEEALCFGWIDSRPAKVDDDRSRILLSPRRPRSVWSALNKRRVAALIAAGRMAAPGQTAIARAKANGSWEAIDAPESGRVPPGLARALRTHREARLFFEACTDAQRRQMLQWISQARREATRARRITDLVAGLALGERANEPAAMRARSSARWRSRPGRGGGP